VKTVCAKHNISEPRYYAWKKKYGGMDVSEARRMRVLEDENARLRRLVADLSVQNQILKEVNSRKW
jgi:putative transposase